MHDFLIMNTLGYPILSLVVFLPLAGAIPLLILKNDEAAKYWTLLITLVIALVSLPLYFKFDRTTALYQFGESHTWIPMWDINYTLGIDGISLLLILLTTLIMPLCVLCSWRYITERVRPFLACLMIMETSMLGVFMSLDFVLFYILWEAMLIPMFLLIAVWGGPRKVYASIKFFLYTLAGSVMLLVAIIALYLHNDPHSFSIPLMMGQGYSSTFQMWVFLAFFLAFAIKVPMFPFHTWLPAAHVEAPTAGSVVLASVLLKMGTYGFLRFCLPITPEATITLDGWIEPWTRPLPWAMESACPTIRPSAWTCWKEARRPDSTSSWKFRPGTCSDTTQRRPRSSMKAMTFTRFGWEMAEAALRSSTTAFSTSWSPTISGGRARMATLRPSVTSSPR